jgi:hypothetical protein
MKNKRVSVAELNNEITALKGAINAYRKASDKFNDDPSGSAFRWRNTCYEIMTSVAFEPDEDEMTNHADYPLYDE